MVGELDDEDTVLCDQADEGDQADLGVNVHAGKAQGHEYKRAGNGHGHRNQDDERVPPTLELGSQDQVDHQYGHEESHDQGAALLGILA